MNEEVFVFFIVNFFLILVCFYNWFLCVYWFKNYIKKWLVVKVKDDVFFGGMYFVVVVINKELDILWEISFCGVWCYFFCFDCDGKKMCL